MISLLVTAAMTAPALAAPIIAGPAAGSFADDTGFAYDDAAYDWSEGHDLPPIAAADFGPERVVGGAPVDREDRRWDGTVGVVFQNAYVGCTGTLVAPDVVVTAAHCTGGISHVIIGAANWVTEFNAPHTDFIRVTQEINHPDYRSTGRPDIAVLKLAEPSSFAPRTIAADCVRDRYLTDGAPVAVVGFGNTNANGRGETTRMHAGFTFVQTFDCSRDRVGNMATGCWPQLRPGGEIGAGGNDVDACFGDSGGPLYLETPEGDLLVGVTSRSYIGAPQTQPCRFGGIYVRPDAFIDFIENRSGVKLDLPVCNLPPAPTADSIRTGRDSAGTTQIFANDPDDFHAAFSYEVVDTPAFGTVDISADGLVTYTPDAGFSGKDWFTVAVTDDGSIYERSGPLTSEVMIEVKVGGCGCATTGSGGASALLSLLALVGLRRRQGLRRRR